MPSLWKMVSTLVVLLLIIVGGLTYFSSYLGWRIDTVLSGSMEPALKVGGVVITHSIPEEEIMEVIFLSCYEHCKVNAAALGDSVAEGLRRAALMKK